MLQIKKEMANISEYKVGNNANFTNFMCLRKTLLSQFMQLTIHMSTHFMYTMQLKSWTGYFSTTWFDNSFLLYLASQWRIQDFPNGGGAVLSQMGGRTLFSGKKCMKLKEIGLKWGGARLLAPCYSKITIFLWIILKA